ncbi:DUF5460 family protein [Rickettsia sp. TH2014]|uniref:DUF5460 family protein n=1 Tax=Rickettsia sp. TH2014 TaxID=1967503 RepID=UPI001C482D03|nr:DUF5460 family protein [Rickettsia sp. TH2014]
MAPVLNLNLNCFMPIFANEMVSSLPGNTKHTIYKLGNTILSSVYNTVKGSFTNGYLIENIKCNWAGISNHLTDVPNDLSAVIRECTGIKIPIKSIATYGNSTSVILEEEHLLQNTTLVELKGCTTTEGEAILQEHNAKMLVNNLRDILNHSEITLKNAQEAGVAIFNLLNIPVKYTADNLKIIVDTLGIISDNAQEAGVAIFNLLNIPVKYTADNLKVILDAFNVTLDGIPPTEVGKNILDLLSKPFTEATTSTTEKPNEDTNGSGYTGAYITATVFGIISLGFAAKYGWDWYKGRNIKNENLELERKNIKLVDENIELKKDILNLKTLIEFRTTLDDIIEIGNLTDILAILSKTNQDTINLHDQDYDISPLKLKIQGLDKAIIKLNSVSNICANINSLGNTLHKICELLNGKGSFISIKSFTNLVTELRKTNIKSEEHKNCLEKIFETLLRIDETSSGEYTYIPEEGLQNHEMPLLADVSSSSSGIGV